MVSLENLPGQTSPDEKTAAPVAKPTPAIEPTAQVDQSAPIPESAPVALTAPAAAPASNPSLNGVNADLASRVDALIAASHGRINVQSGFRTLAQQTALYAKEPNLAAPPGHSNHEKGLAVDLGGDYALIAQLAPQFGLVLPMSWEPWHVELPGQHTSSSPLAYTQSPYGDPNPTADPNLTTTGQYQLATASDAMRKLTMTDPNAPLGELTGPSGAGVVDGSMAATEIANTGTSSSTGTTSAPIGTVPLQPGQTGGDKRVPGHSIQDWAKDVLTGLGAPATTQNMEAMITWANTESGGYNPSVAGGRYNPLNTTEGAVGYVGQGGSQGDIKDFGSYEQGVQAIVHNLTVTKGAGYEPIVAALRAGNNPQAVFQAVNGSAFGTHFGAR